MRLWQRPQRFVALVKERSRAWSSALLVATLTLAMVSFGAITPTPPADAAAAQCPADSTYITYTFSSPNCTATFAYSGAYQTWVVPAGVTSATVTLKGAQGGSSSPTVIAGGAGAVLTGTLTTTPGQSLYVYVGGAGTNSASSGTISGGFNGGGRGMCIGAAALVAVAGAVAQIFAPWLATITAESLL